MPIAQVQYPGVPTSLSTSFDQTNVTTTAALYNQPVANAQFTPFSPHGQFQMSPSPPLLTTNPPPQVSFTPSFSGHPVGQQHALGHHQGQLSGQGYGGYAFRQQLFPNQQ